MVFGGVVLVMAFAFAGHYMGQNAVAHNADPGDVLESISAPSSNILAKGSLMPEATSLSRSSTVRPSRRSRSWPSSGKGDFIEKDMPVVRKAKPRSSSFRPPSTSRPRTTPATSRIVLAPSPKQVEKAVKLKRTASAKPKDKDTQKAIAQRRVQLAEENCLARAVYFEARSESELGQLAVAKVILNRVKDPEYPKTICGVVYQGSGRRNSCQFSFACDGLPDDVKSASRLGQRQAHRAEGHRRGCQGRRASSTATNYHADYVKPKWAKSMKRLVKIGRHIFYEDS